MNNDLPNILIVDDVPANNMAMKLLLKNIGANIIEANSGDDALAKVMKNDIATIILDVQMPKMSGYDVAKILQNKERTKYIPIIFVTANSTGEDNNIKAYKAGGIDYLIKPVNKIVIRSKVKRYVDLYKKSL